MGLMEESAKNLRDTYTMGFESIFYNTNFTRNQWNNNERRGGPQMFASSYEDIIEIGRYLVENQ
uniref:Uncharacterized protein n=1 Tax=Rhizophagus irregularis (strain DAOM 181602 / DAOM 197198 / MUCL 43194) TaxID=747089 RepID=U9TR88_RHIID